MTINTVQTSNLHIVRVNRLRWNHAVGRYIMLAAVSCITIMTVYTSLASPWDVVVFGICFIAFVFGLLQSLYVHDFQLDPNNRTYLFRHGFGALGASVSGPLQGTTLRLEEKTIRNIYGEQLKIARVLLNTEAEEIELIPSGPVNRIEIKAVQLSELSGVRINRNFSPPMKQISVGQRRALTASMWVVLSCVLIVAILPSFKRKPAVGTNLAAGIGLSTNFDYATNRGIMYLRDKDYRSAEKSFREAILLKHNLAQAYNYLAYAYIYQGKFDLGLKAAFNGQKEEPNDGNITDTIGEVYETKGDLKLAVKYYKMALKKMGKNPAIETNFKLGRTLVALKRIKDAEPYLQTAAQFPKFAFGGDAADLLTRLKIPVKRVKSNVRPMMPGRAITPNT